jgi:hypothetical protein
VIDALERPAICVLSGSSIVERPDAELGQLAQQVGRLAGAPRVLGAPLEQLTALAVATESQKTAIERLQRLCVSWILVQKQLKPVDSQLRTSFSLLQHCELEQTHLGRTIETDELLERGDQVLALPRAPKQSGAQLLHVDVRGRYLVCQVCPVERRPQVGGLLELQRRRLERQPYALGGISQRLPQGSLQLVDSLVLQIFGLDLDQASDGIGAIRKLAHDLAQQGADPVPLRRGQELDHLTEHVATRCSH